VSSQEAKALIYYYRTHKHKRSLGDGSDYRAIDLIHIQTQWVRDIFNRIGYACVGEIRKATNQIVYPEMTAFNEWKIGGVQHPHLDTYSNVQIQNELVEETPSREWTVILHLNDEFNGGETYFPDQDNYTNTPKEGEGILFQGLYHQHGVNPVRRCSRYTISMWFTTDPKLILTDARTDDLTIDHHTIKAEDQPFPT
jgi:hypothetical protein